MYSETAASGLERSRAGSLQDGTVDEKRIRKLIMLSCISTVVLIFPAPQILQPQLSVSFRLIWQCSRISNFTSSNQIFNESDLRSFPTQFSPRNGLVILSLCRCFPHREPWHGQVPDYVGTESLKQAGRSLLLAIIHVSSDFVEQAGQC